jgi:hypothetical protein
MKKRHPAFYSPLVEYYYREACACLRNRTYIACVALSQAAVEHAIDFELGGGNSHSERGAINISPGTHYNAKVEHFFKTFKVLSTHKHRVLKLHIHWRNTYLHGVTNRIVGTPVHGRKSLESVHLNSKGWRTRLGFEAAVWAVQDYKCTKESEELALIFSCDMAAKESLEIATGFLADVKLLYTTGS